MKNATIMTHEATFSVNTVHGDQLEFVLHDTAERNGRHWNHYFILLDCMIGDASKDIDTARYMESSLYGEYTITVAAESVEALTQFLTAIDKVIANWIAKYGINRMKKDVDRV